MLFRALRMCLLGVLIALSSTMALAAEDYEAIVQKYFSMLAEGKSAEAVDYLFSGNPWMGKAGSDQMQNFKTQMVNLSKLVGNLKGKEKIIEEKVGANYAYVVYLGLYDRQPVRFKFFFYRPEGKWRFQNFSFDTSIADDIEKEATNRLLESARGQQSLSGLMK